MFASIARIQAEGGRYFLCENPAGSELFQLPAYIAPQRDFPIGEITFPQCQVGLVSPEGLPILKRTTLWSNAEELLVPFHGLACSCRQHGCLEGAYKGISRSKLAQVWPIEMCKRIVEGICCLLRRKQHAFPLVRVPGTGVGHPYRALRLRLWLPQRQETNPRLHSESGLS